MSTYGQLLYKVKQGELIRVLPLSAGALEIRQLYVTKEIWTLLDGPWDTKEEEARYSALYVHLEHFITGGYLVKDYFKWLDEDEDLVFQILSKKPPPSLRLLGRFAKFDVFVGINLEDRDSLGKKGSIEWNRATRRTRQSWDGLFNPYKPLAGGEIHDFVSNAARKEYYWSWRNSASLPGSL